MKFHFILALCLATTFCANAQNIRTDIQRDWYAELPEKELDEMDTLLLQPITGNMIRQNNVVAWQYEGDDMYQMLLYNNKGGLTHPYKFAPEKWSMKREGADVYITVKQGGKKIAEYKAIPLYTDHAALYQIVFVTLWSKRSKQLVLSTPDN
jgi:hypothetical protein